MQNNTRKIVQPSKSVKYIKFGVIQQDDYYMNFYDDKPKNLPRLIYRQLQKAAIEDPTLSLVRFMNDYVGKSKGPDYLKFVWTLPAYLKKSLPLARFLEVQKYCTKRYNQRFSKLKKHIFPHVSDEFSLSQEFLSDVFDVDALCSFNQDDLVYTIGSCFARNFSLFLSSKGVSCKHFGQAEDLNSPGSNQILLEYAKDIDNPQTVETLQTELLRIWYGAPAPTIDRMLEQNVQQLQSLKNNLHEATKVIVTLGNTVDYYQVGQDGIQTLVPKFLAMSRGKDVTIRESISSRLQKLGALIRLSSFSEVSRYIRQVYSHIREINSSCNIIFTVSPVPIDSILGLQGTNLRAVEVDCVSKSTIRAALHEVMHSDIKLLADTRLHYLPSFEIVRWIAPVVGLPVFGVEDAASRHVSNEVLNAVCDFAHKAE
jgi:hypothetical protein